MENKLLVLAGGDGSRLKEVTGAISKPLVKIGKKPVISIILKKMVKELDITHATLLIQEKHQQQYMNFMDNEKDFGEVEIDLFVEESKLGTGGAIKNFLKNSKENSFYVSNADTIIKSDISAFKDADENSILCAPVSGNRRFGAVKIDNEGKIVRFGLANNSQKTIVNAGIYKLSRSIFDHVDNEIFDLEDTLFPLCAKAKLLYGFLMELDFEDIGIPEAYYREHKKNIEAENAT